MAANHNSHLDTLVLMALYPLGAAPGAPGGGGRLLPAQPLHHLAVTQPDRHIPLDRQGQVDKEQVFEQCQQALADGQILLLFPEGSRGEAEELQPLRKGIYHLARSHAGTQVVPIAMHGLGRALPKGGSMIVPFMPT
ncbi:lysophospholipid acyltransferase family protein [Halopseudomonas pachastrellae]|nr:lysophospholipid acyltransferase family protein [Halopseudomonas pachastrellae]